MTGDLTLANPGSIPTITKTMTIDVGGFQLIAPASMTLDVASGAELTVDGSVRINGTPGFQGSLFKGGAGLVG